MEWNESGWFARKATIADCFIFHDLVKAPSLQFEMKISVVYILPCQLILKSSLRMRRILAMLPCNDSR